MIDNTDILESLGQWELTISAFDFYEKGDMKYSEFKFVFNKEILN